ncbi:MAG: phosphoribosylformylglycinamidine synthase subunit PurQ [Bacteroidetes bacterium]|nr:phosphoribosylformylglycinamidine synthase subunit PurQ [Bacteroidota bacterium]
MKCGVVIFPGSNCDRDLIEVLKDTTGSPVTELWHRDTDLQGCTHIFLPGGFSYGDYLRSGAIAKLSPVMQSVISHAANGGFVFGICNGFQILCESGLLPGALLRNTSMKFSSKNVFLKPGNLHTAVTEGMAAETVLKVPIAHGEGRYYADETTLAHLEQNGQVVFRYCSENGTLSDDANPNGSLNHIAGICNSGFNVFGMMPHPERCAMEYLHNTNGRAVFQAIVHSALTTV